MTYPARQIINLPITDQRSATAVIAPHSTLYGCIYTVKLCSGPRFPEVPCVLIPPLQGDDLAVITQPRHFWRAQPSCVADVELFRYSPPPGLSPRFYAVGRDTPHFLSAPFPCRPICLKNRNESNGGITPPSAQRSMASSTKSTTLHRTDARWHARHAATPLLVKVRRLAWQATDTA